MSKIRDMTLAYTPKNIVGVVSQSGGVPTGAIIERGSNANGKYIKYADGTLECTMFHAAASVAFSAPANAPANTVSANFSLTTPYSFVGNYGENVVSGRGGDALSAGWFSGIVTGSALTLTYFSFGPAGNRNVDLNIHIIGRWF